MSYSIYDTIYINSSTGKVGIGTTLSVNDKLTLWSTDIAGIRVQSFTDYAWSIYVNSNNTQGYEIGVNAENDPDAPGYGYLWTYDNTHGIHFGTNDTERMRIEPNGDITFGDYFSIANTKNISFILQNRLQADNAVGSQSFGNAVAISADGNTLAIGCILDSHSGGIFAGSVFIFTRTNSIWTQQARLQATDAAFNDWFGFSVAISSDGNTVAIGSVQDDNSGGTDAGSAYIFTRTGSSWSQQARLQASDAAASNAFGWAITISSDGNTVAVSAVFSTSSFLPAAGSVYIFTRSDSVWTQQARLQGGDPGINDQFGYSVALSPDSNTLAVGSWLDDNSGGTDAGSTYIFTRSGSVWTQQARLQASDALTRNQFGFSVALSIDGNILAVGANRHYNEGEIDSGSVYIFRRTGSVWTEEIRLKPSDAAQEDYFGRSVSISSDGNTLAVGAIWDDNPGGIDAGAAYVFVYENSTWTEVSKLLATDPSSEDWFGISIALSADAVTLAVGANRHDNTGGTDAGSVFVFTNKFMGVIGIGTTDPLSKIHIYYDDLPKADLLRVDSYSLTTPFVVNSGGNVGIGTTYPQERLHIHGNIAISGSGKSIGTITNDSFTLKANNINSITIDTLGNVGIGSTQPTYQLDVQNNIRCYTNVYDVMGLLSTGYGNYLHIEAANRGQTFAKNIVFNRFGGNIGIGTTNPIVSFHVNRTDSILLPKGTTSQRPSGVTGFVRYNTDLNQFEGYGAGNAWGSLGGVKSIDQLTYITADNTSNISFYTGGQLQAILNPNGNLGIGTTSPIVSLHVEKTDSILLPKGTTSQRPEGVTGFVRYNTDLNQFEGFGAGNTWGSLGGVKSTDQQTYITAENDSNLRFYTGGVERMIFDPNGNLGIGTTDPIVSLHVERTDSILLPKGTISERPTGVTGLVRYNTELNQFEGFGAGNAWGSLGGVKSTDQSTYITAENDSNIRFFTSTVQQMVLNSNGNLGIGNTEPLEKFHLTGNMLIEGDILPSACNVYSIGSSNFRFKDIYLSGNTIDLGGTLISRDSLTGRISFRSTGGTENDKLDLSVRSILVDNSVGIGTHIATQSMHVQGNLYASGSLIASNLVLFGETLVIDTVTSNANQVIIENMGSGPALKVIQAGNNSVAEFYDKESGIALFIENTGLVGIQTSIPTEALHIKGTVLSTAGYKVNSTIAISNTLMHYVDSSRGIRNVTGQYGTVQTTGEGVGNWEGYSIDGRYVLMSSDNNTCGLYNDIDNQWMLYFTRSTNANGTISLYYAGTEKLSTTSTGISVSGNILFGTGANKGTLTYPTNTAATFTIPNTGSADFVMTAGNQSVGGLKVFPSNVGIGTTVARDPLDVVGNARVSGILSSGTYQINGVTVIDGSRNVTLGSGTFTTTGSISSGAINTGTNNITTNNLVFGTGTNKGTLTYPTNTAATFTIPNTGSADFVMTAGTQTINGTKTFGSTISGSITGNAETVTNGVYTSRNISTSTGLSGGGNLSTDRTLSIDSTVFYSGGSVNGNLRFTAGDGTGVRFWDSDSYKIWMSASGNATWGGRLDGDSDYNMYFRMTGGTNRGFVFKNSTTNIAQIRGNGDFYFTGTLQQGTIPNARTTATSANTANSIITRDGSGNFTAGTMSGNLSGTATNATNVTITNDTSTNAVEFITFVGANSGNQAINTNSSQLTFNPSTGSVGIGTTVPRQKLDVVGTISASSFSGSFSGNITGTATAASSLTSGATITPWGATFDTAWGSQPSITFPSGNTQLRLHNNTGQCDFWVDGLVNTLVGVQLNGTTVIDSSRNLINIVSATVSSGISITGGLAANTWIGASIGGAGGTNVVVIGNLGGTPHIGGHNQALSGWADLIFQRDGGNVGISTQTPTAKLDVRGTIRGDAFTISGTTVIDGSRNLTNIGTIGSGAITCTSINTQTNTITAGAVNSSSFYTTGNSVINNGSPTIILQDTDNRSAMIHCNANLLYILRGDGNNSTNWATTNGVWPCYWNLENNNQYAGGDVHIIGDARSFRQNNTSTWGGDPGTGVGKIEYYSNRWYIVSGSDSAECLRIRRSATDVFAIDNSGVVTTGNVPWARLSSVPSASTTVTGIVRLNNATNSTSTTQAATANAVKLANDNANTRAPANQTMHIGTTAVQINRPSGALSLTGVSIDGTSGSVGGISANNLFNNMGANHGDRSDFNTIPNFGTYYVTGNTNGPGVNSASQYYAITLGLGAQYPWTGVGSYGVQIAIPRGVSNPYIAIRYNENNSLNAWQRISAGYADSAGSVSQTLTRGSYLTGANYNGSAATTWAVDATEAATASKIVARDSSADINCRLVRPNFANESTISGAMAYRVNNSTNNYIRFCSDTGAIRTFLNVPPTSRNIATGNGLSGGGDLSADRTLTINTGVVVTIGDAQTITGVKTFSYGGTNAGNIIKLGGSETTYGENIYSIQWGGSGQMGMGPYPSARGYFSKQGLCIHIINTEEFSIKTSGWTNRFGVDMATGDVKFTGTLQEGTVPNARTTATSGNTANAIVARDGNGDFTARYVNTTYVNMSHSSSTRSSDSVFYSSTDNYIRKNNATGMRASLSVPTRTGGDASGNWSINAAGLHSTPNISVSIITATGFNIGTNTVINSSGNISFSGTATTTNQNRGIYWSAYDKEGTTDFSDTAYIRHTVNVGGLAGSVLELSSQNDTNDGINLVTPDNSTLRHNGNIVLNAANYNGYAPTLTGGNASGTWGINITGQSRLLKIFDVRSEVAGAQASSYMPLPNDAFWNLNVRSVFAENQGNNGSWCGVLTVKGWSTGSYAVWQLSGSATTSRNDELYFRDGIGTTWGSWHRILHSGNINSITVASATNANTAGGLAVHTGRNNEVNKIVRTDGNGYILAGWINTTSGDNGNTVPSRFYSSHDEYIRYHTRNTYKMHLGLTGKYDRGRVQDTTDTNYWTGAMGWGTTDWNTVATWGSGFVDSWSNPGNRPGDSSHHVGIQAFHYTAGANVANGWQLVGGPTDTWSIRRAWSTWGSWYTLLHSGNYNSYSPTLTGGGASGNWNINAAGLYNSPNITVGTVNASGNITNGGFDFILGTTDQSSRGNTGSSRALVKGSGGVLGINWANDFSGGTLVDSILFLSRNATYYRQNSTATWGGNTGTGWGKIEYHSNRWYIVAGSDSTECLVVRRSGSDVFRIDNSGVVTAGSVPVGRITGTLPVANGGTGTTSSTGSGSVVLSASPTLTGTLNAATISASGTVTGTQFILNANANFSSSGSGQTIGITSGGVSVGTIEPYGLRLTQTGYWQNISLAGGIYIGTLETGSISFKSSLLYIYHLDGSPSLLATFKSNGNFGIGINDPQYKLHVNGAIYATGDITALSDKTHKTNIHVINNALSKLQKISGYTFQFKEDPTEKYHAGLLAQEVQEVLPEVVTENQSDGSLGLAYGNIISLVVNAVKELDDKVEPKQITQVIDDIGSIVYISEFKEDKPVLSLTNKPNDKRVYGIVTSKMEKQNTQLCSLYEKDCIVKTKGFVSIWVTNCNGIIIEQGDYITSSKLSGYGMCQGSSVLNNFTIGKSLVDIDFTDASLEDTYKVRYLSSSGLEISTEEFKFDRSYIAVLIPCSI